MTVPRRLALDFLRSGPATSISHRNGTLLDHLLATEALLRSWGSTETLSRAGLCHAAYGTDGFAPHLLSWRRRPDLAALVGADVEKTVYFYAACDRSVLYPQLPGAGPVHCRDRFLDTTLVPSAAQLTDFVDLTLANELEIALGDVPSTDPPVPPPWITALVDQMVDRASPAARRGVARLLPSAVRR
jgi:hypothetical protein